MIELNTLSIKRNFDDVDKAIKEVRSILPELEEVLNSSYIDPITNLLDEYECHLREDIEPLLEAYDEYEDYYSRKENES